MNITTNQDTSFLITSEIGDILPQTDQGFYDADTRFLSDYRFLIAGQQFNKLTGRPVSYYSSVHYLTNPQLEGVKQGTIEVARDQTVGNGFHEDIRVINYNTKPVELSLRMISDTDFADIFEVKAKQPTEKLEIEKHFDKEHNILRMVHKNNDFYRETRIKISLTPNEMFDDGLLWRFSLGPKESWHLCCDILPLSKEEQEYRTTYTCGELGLVKIGTGEHFEEWRSRVASIDTSYVELQQAYDQSINDLASLRIAGPEESDVPAAGIPWFMTYFGRDSLITALQTLFIAPSIAKGVLQTLSQYQGKEVDEASEEQPGKILHEVRFGRLAKKKGESQSVYYGSIDSTLLFIILLHDYYLHTGDAQLLEKMKPNLLEAMAWINAYGDRDGDGYLEYKRSHKNGLFNQAWKDSFDGISYSDGSIPETPLATCEVQGYAYDAKIKGSLLLLRLGKKELAKAYREEAADLKKRFATDFWMDDAQFFALALDKNKNKVDSITSNPGHLLWSKIIDDKKAKLVAEKLLSDELYSGWGVRTLSSDVQHYNPMSYHNGSVWPHDNSIIAKGLMNYGHIGEAHRIIEGILQASKYFSYMRLPELFCGFYRKSTLVPIEYPSSNSPQAWAAGSVPYMLSSILGISLEASSNSVIIDPKPLPKIDRLEVKGLSVLGQKVDLLVRKKGEEVKTEILNNPDVDIKTL